MARLAVYRILLLPKGKLATALTDRSSVASTVGPTQWLPGLKLLDTWIFPATDNAHRDPA